MELASARVSTPVGVRADATGFCDVELTEPFSRESVWQQWGGTARRQATHAESATGRLV